MKHFQPAYILESFSLIYLLLVITIMKKTLLISGFFFISFLTSEAQFKQIAAGPSFNEPYSEFSKLLIMKTGGVLFFQLDNSNVDVRVYDASHKETFTNSFVPEYGYLKSGNQVSIFEINGDAVLFIGKTENSVPVLYRLIIDGTTGALIKEERLSELKKFGKGIITGLKFSTGKNPFFYVNKDPDSENYALTSCNNFEEGKTKRIDIVLYDNKHQEISRAFYEFPEGMYEFMTFGNMAVIGSEKVYLLVNGYKKEGKDDDVFLVGLKKGVPVLSFNLLSFTQERVFKYGLVSYNRNTNKLLVVVNMYKPGHLGLDVNLYIAFIDPDNGKTEKIIQTEPGDAINQKGKEIFGKKYKFWGNPEYLYYNKDGDFSVVYEEFDRRWISGIKHASLFYLTCNVVVANYSKSGVLNSSYMIPKIYNIDQPGTFTYYGGFGNQYRKITYLNGNDKSYILMNDTPRNIENIEKNKEPVEIIGLHDCEAFYFPLTGNDPIPQRKYLFGESGTGNTGRSPSPFGISAYDKVNDVFITLRLNKEAYNKTVSVVWLKPE